MIAILILIAALLFILVCNLIVSYRYTAQEMHDRFIEGQCLVGKIAANIFYSPAWALKGLRLIVDWGVAK